MKLPETIKYLEGDAQQVRALSSIYNKLLEAKDLFIEKAAEQYLTAEQIANAEFRLVIIDAEMKNADRMIHYLMFGGELEDNSCCKPLKWQVEKAIEQDIYFERPDITRKQDLIGYEKKRLEFLELKVNREFRLRCKLQQENWKLKKQLKERQIKQRHATIFTGIPGPLKITIPNENR